MFSLLSRSRSLLCSERRGVTALEYGLIAGLFIVAVLFGVNNIGGSLNNAYQSIAAEVGFLGSKVPSP